jgi:hypothetical protein
MHFTTLYLLKGEELDNIGLSEIEEDFGDRFCYCCGETRPRYRYWCDWFQIGGRWCDLLLAKRGIVGSRAWGNKDDEAMPNRYSIVEIKDLEEDINDEFIYAVATKSRIFMDGDEEYHKLLKKINNKEIKGVIALIDCHD